MHKTAKNIIAMPVGSLYDDDGAMSSSVIGLGAPCLIVLSGIRPNASVHALVLYRMLLCMSQSRVVARKCQIGKTEA